MRLRRIIANGALLAGGLAVALVVAEVATRLFAPQPMSSSWFVYGPRGIMMNKASGRARDVLTAERTAYYEFNSWHQRGREEPESAAARVLVLGDSFTFGVGLAQTDTYVGRLQESLDKRPGPARIQLLNAAAGGWGTADQLAYLETFGPRLNPSAVVVFVNVWDVARARALAIYRVDADGRGLSPAASDARRHFLKSLLQDSAAYEFLLDHSHLVQLIRHALIVADGRATTARVADRQDRTNTISDAALFGLLMHRMAAWCAERDVQLTVLTTGWPEIDYPWIDSVMQAEGIFFRPLGDSVATRVRADFDAYSIKDDGHPNEAAARLIADAAWPILEARLGALRARPLSQ
jgi:lysophospholipase L1-like esterase